MSDLKLDLEESDLAIENGDLVLTEGADATRQRVQQSLRSIKGEWFLDLEDGVPYFQDVLVKNPNASTVDAVLRDAILSTDGVVELTEFKLDFDVAKRELFLEFECVSIDGDVLVFTETLGA